MTEARIEDLPKDISSTSTPPLTRARGQPIMPSDLKGNNTLWLSLPAKEMKDGKV